MTTGVDEVMTRLTALKLNYFDMDVDCSQRRILQLLCENIDRIDTVCTEKKPPLH